MVVDARTVLDLETTPYRIPGARRVDPRGAAGTPALALDKGIVFYCSEPNEATSPGWSRWRASWATGTCTP